MYNPKANTYIPSLTSTLISACLGDGTGEYFLDTNIVYTKNSFSDTIQLNNNTDQNRADILVALDNLQATYPNLTHIDLPIAWFADNMSCGSLLIKPGTTSNFLTTTPYNWSVQNFDRGLAKLMTGGAKPFFNGTPSDQSVLRLVLELQRRGIQVTLNPIILVDIDNTNALPNPYNPNVFQFAYPDTALITPYPARSATSPAIGSAVTTQINRFFGSTANSSFNYSINSNSILSTVYTGDQSDFSYQRFILHYAFLMKVINARFNNPIRGIVVGNSLLNLTKAYDGVGYPAVNNLNSLVNNVKAITNKEVSYAAHLNEWNNDKGVTNSYVNFNMDPLWANPNLDYIGLSWFSPLTDWRDQHANIDKTIYGQIYSQPYLNYNVEGGEYYDFVYLNTANRDNQFRQPIVDPLNKPWVFRDKDIKNWWLNQHINRSSPTTEVGSPSPWVPQSKRFRIVETGFNTVDKATNRPTKNKLSTIYYSNGNPDTAIKKLALTVAVGYWNDPANNIISSQYNGYMVDTNISAYFWETRPYSWYPTLTYAWPDTYLYSTGITFTGLFNETITTALKVDVDYEKLMTPYFAEKAIWSDLAATMTTVLNPNINNPIQSLKTKRDPNLCDPIDKAYNVRMMGFKVPTAGLNDDEYDRLMRNLGTFYQTSGSSSDFINFLSYIRNTNFKYIELFLNGLDINTLTNNTNGNYPWDATPGTKIPSVYYSVEYNASIELTINETLYRELFLDLAPAHLVLRSFIGVIEIPATTLYLATGAVIESYTDII